jgi:membrane dipeptidase
MYAHVDLPRLKEGKNGGAFWSAFVPCPANWSDFSDENYAACMASLLSF